MIVRSNAIGIPLLAIIQGGVAMIGYLIFGAPNIDVYKRQVPTIGIIVAKQVRKPNNSILGAPKIR